MKNVGTTVCFQLDSEREFDQLLIALADALMRERLRRDKRAKQLANPSGDLTQSLAQSYDADLSLIRTKLITRIQDRVISARKTRD